MRFDLTLVLMSCNVFLVASKGLADKGFQMSENKGFCFDCEEELTDENTTEFGGFDGSNYLASRTYGGSADKEPFTKCDSCFNADIDRYLEN